MKAVQVARRRSANHALLNGPDVYDCFALPAKFFNTFGDLLQMGVSGAACVGQIRVTLWDQIRGRHINGSQMFLDFFFSCFPFESLPQSSSRPICSSLADEKVHEHL